jgi:type II secretory pathway component PulF
MKSSAYRYRAARPDGAIEIGSGVAESADAIAGRIRARGYWVLEVHEDPLWSSQRRMSADDLAVGLRLFASFLESGLPMARALAALEDVAPDPWREVLPGVREAVRRGESLATALAAAPRPFPPVVIGIVRAGEIGSGLPRALARAATLAEGIARTRAALRAALAYPCVLAVAGMSALGLLVGVVLPRFAAILGDLGQALPATTQIVLEVGALARALMIPGIIAGGALLATGHAWIESPSGRLRWHEWLLSVPSVGAVRRASATSRIACALAALLESGVPMAAALPAAAAAGGDTAIARRLTRVRERIVSGESLSAALGAERAATTTIERLVRAGEESGQLVEMLDRGAMIERERAERSVQQFVRVLEPGLIVAFGGVVAFVAAALLQAVYSVRPTP